MSTEARPSAKIYQFPVRERRPTRPDRGAPVDPRSCVPSVISSGWYHEAAIQDDKSRKS